MIEVEQIDFQLSGAGPRSVRLDARVNVKKKVVLKSVRGAVTFAGRLEIDERLVAKL